MDFPTPVNRSVVNATSIRWVLLARTGGATSLATTNWIIMQTNSATER
jgi:hypothetical protein